MAKKVEQPKPKSIIEIHPKLYKDISDEIMRFMDEIKYEIQCLEQHCKKVVTEPCESDWDLRSLAQLKNKLETLGYEVLSPSGRDWLQLTFEHRLIRILAVLLIAAGIVGDRAWLAVIGAGVLVLGVLASGLRRGN